MNDRIRELVLDHKPATAIREAAIESGMVSLQDASKAKVLDGTTSIEELRRVIFMDEDH
ncbi:MAG: hypothetical protein HYY39_00525 [Armatimonadetes bacterium]|nr:hypothetical protein [Armatimonadota bacterium]